MFQRFIRLAFLMFSATLIASCGGGGGGDSGGSVATSTYTVTYFSDLHEGGTVPIDATNYKTGQTVTVANSGDLVLSGSTFAGWDMALEGMPPEGNIYTPGQTFVMGSANVVMTAVWTEATYTVTYDGNGSTGGSVPIDGAQYMAGGMVAVLGNSGGLVNSGYVFNGWNTQADGGGTTYTQEQTYVMGTVNTTLYAKWTANPTYTVTYNGNGNSGGSVPTDWTHYETGQPFVMLSNSGNLVSTGYDMVGWNALADGSGTNYAVGQLEWMGVADVTLYAKWKPNQLDTSFSTDGKLIHHLGDGYDRASAVAIQPDGSVVVAGYAQTATGGDLAVVRYNAKGQPDISFGKSGVVTTNLGGMEAGASAIAIQPSDNKIVVAGGVVTDTGVDVALVRYNPDGTLDTSFGINGMAITDLGGGGFDATTAMAIQANGRIVLAGYSDAGPYSSSDIFLVRYDPNGVLDASFGTGGIVFTNVGVFGGAANAIAVQPDNMIVVAGAIRNMDSGHPEFALLRYDKLGTLDPSFGTAGIVKTAVGTNDAAYGIVIQPLDNMIVVAGTSLNAAGNEDIALARYNIDGTLDNNFGSGGTMITDLGGTENARAVAIQPDGKLVVAGGAGTSPYDFVVARYNSTALDSTFATDGYVITDFGGSSAANAVAISPDGRRIVAAGSTTVETLIAGSPIPNNDFALAVYVP